MENDQFQQKIQQPADHTQTTDGSYESMPSVPEPVVYLEPVPEPKIYEYGAKNSPTDLGWKLLVGSFAFLVFLTFLGFATFLLTPSKQQQRTNTAFSLKQSSGFKVPSSGNTNNANIPQTEEEKTVQAISVGNVDQDLQTLNDLMQQL